MRWDNVSNPNSVDTRLVFRQTTPSSASTLQIGAWAVAQSPRAQATTYLTAPLIADFAENTYADYPGHQPLDINNSISSLGYDKHAYNSLLPSISQRFEGDSITLGGSNVGLPSLTGSFESGTISNSHIQTSVISGSTLKLTEEVRFNNNHYSRGGANNLGRQGITLFGNPNVEGNSYGMGIQFGTLYSRVASSGTFRWYKGGIHTTDAVPGGNGQELMTLGGNGITVNNMATKHSVEGTNFAISAVAAPGQTGSPVCGFSFTAPPSGNVLFYLSMNAIGSGSSVISLVPMIRTGSTVGSGTVIHTGSTQRGPGINGGNSVAGVSYLVNGLTAGTVYNVCTAHSGSGTVYYRSIGIQPSM